MKINKKTIKKPLLIICIIMITIVVIAGCIAGYLYLKNRTPDIITPTETQKIDYNPPSAEQKQASEDQKKLNNEPPASTTVSISITSANSTADTVQIRSIINGAISNNGTCSLTLTNDGTVVTKTSATYAMPNSSTCQGFDINRSELSLGKWQIALDATIDGEKANTTGEINLE